MDLMMLLHPLRMPQQPVQQASDAFLEQKQHAWYEALLAPHLQEANRARPLRRDSGASRQTLMGSSASSNAGTGSCHCSWHERGENRSAQH